MLIFAGGFMVELVERTRRKC